MAKTILSTNTLIIEKAPFSCFTNFMISFSVFVSFTKFKNSASFNSLFLWYAYPIT